MSLNTAGLSFRVTGCSHHTSAPVFLPQAWPSPSLCFSLPQASLVSFCLALVLFVCLMRAVGYKMSFAGGFVRFPAGCMQ